MTPKGLSVFCGPVRQIAPPRGFPGAALYGVRTFLDIDKRHRDRPTNLRQGSSYLFKPAGSIYIP